MPTSPSLKVLIFDGPKGDAFFGDSEVLYRLRSSGFLRKASAVEVTIGTSSRDDSIMIGSEFGKNAPESSCDISQNTVRDLRTLRMIGSATCGELLCIQSSWIRIPHRHFHDWQKLSTQSQVWNLMTRWAWWTPVAISNLLRRCKRFAQARNRNDGGTVQLHVLGYCEC